MKKLSRLGVTAVFVFAAILSLEAQTARQRQLIDTGWRFQLGDPADVLTNPAETNVAYYPEISDLPKLETGQVSGTGSETYMETLRVNPVATHLGENVSFVQTNFDDSAWRLLNLPHDWVVELPFNSSADGGHGYKPVGNSSFGINNVGWYRRTFTLPAGDAGQTLWLEFDGVYRNCLVWLNGHILGRNVSGYSSFYFDISKYANPGGTNVLVVRVDASRFEGWFYEGAGIYRHVWLVNTSPLHVAHWGTYVTSAVTGSNATVTVQTQVNNDNTNSPATCDLNSTILDPDGNAVATTTANSLTIAAGTNLVVTQTLQVTNARLWSLSSPNLYQLVSTVMQSGTTNDTYETPFGIRTIQFDPNLGLFLNGQSVKIQGTCNHQDSAGVGTALPDRLQYYRVERLKEMGCNVYRTAHGPPSPELLDACDQLGMLVLDENRRIGTNAEPLSELQRLILRDRNHPSVFCWSMANEEVYLERDNTTGASIMQAMVNLVHQLDPSRKCTAAMDSFSSGTADGFSTAVDVQGFNYMNHGNEDSFHSSNPTMPCFGTEEASTVFTRGIYANTSTYVSAYDVNLVNSITATAEAWWQYYTARPWVSGACDWTGFDYRGEPTPFGWPNISSEFGALDTCGFPKDVYYYYQANWTGKNVLHIFPHWNWAGKEGQAINIWCFSDCDAVELFLNGASQGMKPVGIQSHLEWNVPYTAGTLTAIGYRNGRAAITNTIVTTGAPAGILLQPDRSTILADGRDVSVVNVAVVDAQGNIVPTASNTINFTLTGGAIIGVGNGDPASLAADKPTSPTSAVRSVFNGWAQVIVQSTNQAGTITLTAGATGLPSTNVTITAALSLPPPSAPVDLQAAAGNGQIWLNWDNVPGATGYNVKRSTTSGGSYTTVAGAASSSFFTDTGLTNGTTYYYVVSAVNKNGEGTNSVESSATPLPLPVPTSPTSPKAVPLSSTQISLSWSASAAAASYLVKRSTTNGGPYTVIGTATNSTFVDAGLTSTTTYYYVVSATNSAGVSADSAQASATTVVGGQATMVDVGASAPTRGPLDIAQLLNTSQQDDTFNYYTDNGVTHNEWSGQTFTTGTNATGYVLNTLAWKSAGNGKSFPTIQLYDLYIYSLSADGVTATLVASYQGNGGGTENDWFQWRGLNVLLAPNTKYGYAFGRDASGTGWEHIGDQGGNPYTGGGLCQIPASGGAVTYGASGTSDATFSLGFVAASAPGLVTNIAPAPVNIGYVGQTLTYSAAFIGTLPISYQWMVDHGSGPTPISAASNPSAVSNTLVLSNLQLTNAGIYSLTASNSVGGPVSSSSSTLTVLADPAPPAPGTYGALVLSNHPVAFWLLNETNDPSTGILPAYDLSGNKVFGLYATNSQNGFNGVQGPRAPAYAGFPTNNTALGTVPYTSTNSFVAASAGSLMASNLTYAMWIKPSGPVQNWTGLLMDRAYQGTGFGFGGATDGTGMSELAYTWNNNTTWSYNSHLFPSAHQWCFVAMVIQPTQATIYLITTNGVQTATNAIAHDSEAVGGAWRIGDDADGSIGGNVGIRTFPGAIADVSVFLSALSGSQLTAIYQAGVTPPQPPAVTLSIVPVANNSVTLTWPQGTLLEATNVTGPWITNTATSPCTVGTTNVRMFFRAVQ